MMSRISKFMFGEPCLYLVPPTPRSAMFVSETFEGDDAAWILILEDEQGEMFDNLEAELTIAPLSALKRISGAARRSWQRDQKMRQEWASAWEEVSNSWGRDFARENSRRLPDGKGGWIDL